MYRVREGKSKVPGKRGHIVAHDVSWAAQTGKHLLQTQNVSEQRHKICVGNKCWARGQTCVGNNVSATMCPRLPGPLGPVSRKTR